MEYLDHTVLKLSGVFMVEIIKKNYTVKLKWLEHLWDYENLFETGVVRATEGLL